MIDSDGKSKHVDYLGFSFDGVSVRLRQRTVGRYYRRMYRRIDRMYRWKFRPSEKRVRSLYLDFSDWGRDPKKNKKGRRLVGRQTSRGNFLSYADKAQRAFADDPILSDVKDHKRKIRKRAKKVRRMVAKRRSSLAAKDPHDAISIKLYCEQRRYP